jgi:hypothetical protein
VRLIIIHGYSTVLGEHGTAVVKANAASRKVAGSRPDEVIFFSLYLILPVALSPEVHSALT